MKTIIYTTGLILMVACLFALTTAAFAANPTPTSTDEARSYVHASGLRVQSTPEQYANNAGIPTSTDQARNFVNSSSLTPAGAICMEIVNPTPTSTDEVRGSRIAKEC